jgi:hypothetical protein
VSGTLADGLGGDLIGHSISGVLRRLWWGPNRSLRMCAVSGTLADGLGGDLKGHSISGVLRRLWWGPNRSL